MVAIRRHPAGRFGRLESQDVGLEASSLLLGEGVVFAREQTLVEYVRDGADPTLVEMMEDTRIDASPVMDWHMLLLGFASASVDQTGPSL